MTASKACAEPGCPHLVSRTYCQRHDPRRSIYTYAHAQRSKATRAAQPWCSVPGCTNTDLTADHIVPGDPESPLRTLCRSHNSERANRGRAGRNFEVG